MIKEYDYIIIGAGITGCSIAFELQKDTDSILLIDKNIDVAQGASGAAGAFLSPLLGKPNKFKDLVTSALKYSTKFYIKNTPKFIEKCGTIRIPKDEKDKEKFNSYINYMDFEYSKKEDGYFFEIGSVADGYNICKTLVKNIQTKFNYSVDKIEYKNNLWKINNEYFAKNLIITTGANTKLIKEKYFNIRAVWGQRIDIHTASKLKQNYHKDCSVSKSFTISKDIEKISIGATHHRLNDDTKHLCTQCSNICIKKDDTISLLEKAKKIVKLENIEVIKEVAGARACSIDYFPIVGELINSEKTINEFPYIVNGTNVQDKRFTKIKNLYVINGVGGRGYVLAPYLAKKLYEYITKNIVLYDTITPNRLFKRWVKKKKI
jgi:tRNA 5-methylaminomethyl-2-thiouridine biosynthesis bifunctional protein